MSIKIERGKTKKYATNYNTIWNNIGRNSRIKTILSFGYAKDVLVIKAHRHFDLKPYEAMFEKQVGDDGSSDASPVPYKDIIAQKGDFILNFLSHYE